MGFLGARIMGGAIAAQILAAGHDLTVFDPRREAAGPVLESGAHWTESPAAVARASEVVFASLPSPTAAEPATQGPDGVFTAGPGASVSIDLTTNRPSFIRRLAATAAEPAIVILFPVGYSSPIMLRMRSDASAGISLTPWTSSAWRATSSITSSSLWPRTMYSHC